jgi:dipeptidyl aminopeptidase/acylaminoacyl peptidase
MVAYIGFDDKLLGYQNDELYVMNRDGSGRRSLTAALDRSVDSPRWSADGRALFVAYDDRGTRKVARVGLDGSVRTVAEGLSGGSLDRPYTGGTFTIARDGRIAAMSGSAQRPPDVALYSGGGKRQLTRLNAELLDNKTLGEVRRITARSFDNREIEGWLTLPPTWSEGGGCR